MATKKKTKPETQVQEPGNSIQTVDFRTQQQSLLAVIAKAAADPKVNVAKMESLLNMQERIADQQAKMAFQLAMRDCQGEILPVARSAENPHTKSKFAKLEKIDEAIRPIYTRHGFSLSFDSEELPNGKVKVFCYVMHIDGHTKTHQLTGALDTTGAKGGATKTDMQGLGSSVSYLKRYLTCMIFNIQLKDEDNDGGKPKPNTSNDAFSNRVKADNSKVDKAPVSDAQYEEIPPDENKSDWSGKIMIGGKAQNITSTAPAGAGRYLIGVISKRKHKQSRIDLINENIELLHALKAAGNEAMVQEMHTLAEEGE